MPELEPRKKVLVLIHEALYGGGSKQSFFILEGLFEAGHLPVLVSNAAETSLGKRLAARRLPVKTYYNGWIRRKINPFIDFGVFLYLLWVMIRERPDIVLGSGVKLLVLGSVAAWLCRVPHRYVIVRGQGAAEGSRLMPVIYALERLLNRLGTRYITVSEYNRQDMLRRRVAPEADIVTVHNGTDIDTCRGGDGAALRRRFGIPEDAFLIGMVGRLTPQKRYDAFIDLLTPLCRENPSVYGLLVGEGEDRQRLQELIDTAGLSERIRITGYITAMADVYAALNLSVLLTHYEGCPNALLESAAAGVPMLAEAVCGNPEVCRHGETGFVVAPGDLGAALAHARKLIADPALARQLGDNGRHLAETAFDRHRQVRRLIDLMIDWQPQAEPISTDLPQPMARHSAG